MKCERCNRGQIETHEYEYNNRTTRLCGSCAVLVEAAHGELIKVRRSKDSGNAPAAETESDEPNEPVADESAEVTGNNESSDEG